MELTADGVTVTIDVEHGARIASLLLPRASGEPLELVGRYTDSPHGWGAFPMAPFAGRLRDARLTWRGQTHQLPANKAPNAIHGTVARTPWEVVEGPGRSGAPADGEQRGSSAVLRTDLGEDWPWAGHAVLRYELTSTSLSTTLEVHAETEEMPAWCGVHPWFPRRLAGADVHLDLSARAALVDEGGLPTGAEVPVPGGPPESADLDTVFADVAWPVTLTWPGVARLQVSADAPWGVVFTQREPAVCVEPQTAPPDAANLGLAGIAAPGAPVVLQMVWRFEALGG